LLAYAVIEKGDDQKFRIRPEKEGNQRFEDLHTLLSDILAKVVLLMLKD
jgi:hypothetical protein